MIPLASFGDESPSKLSRVPNTALSGSLWVARQWPSKSFKRMARTAVPQNPIACALLDEWHQQLFMRHELRSNLVAAIAPCFSDVCGYSCKDVQTPWLTVRSCSPLHFVTAWQRNTGAKRKSLLFLAFGPKFWRSQSQRLTPEFIDVYLKQRARVWWRRTWNRRRSESESPRCKRRFSHLTWQHKEWSLWQASAMNPQASYQGCPTQHYHVHCG